MEMTDPHAIAEKLQKNLFRFELWPDKERYVNIIATALRDYGEACVKEALCDEDPEIQEYIDEAHAQGRAEAFEEAAKILDREDTWTNAKGIARRIRALAHAGEKGENK